MAEYETEEERAEAVKAWLRRNGGPILAGIVLGLALLFGWRWYQGHRQHQAEQASVRYEQLQNDLQNGKLSQARHLGEMLTSNYGGTPYASLGALAVAKADVDSGNLTGAESELRWVLKNGSPKALIPVANMRLARVLMADKKYESALKLVGKAPSKAYRPLFAEIRGDIEAAAGHDRRARKDYQQALQAGNDDPLLQMKLNDLGGAGS
ncbi:MAG TPA: tetratricopeptide repeat protein [Gammaproteobacteria bacterium]|nr:tetratricopeptide repeat protein [Gammaproteobacteria bacterium]